MRSRMPTYAWIVVAGILTFLTARRIRRACSAACPCLHGKLVVVDGFRCADFHRISEVETRKKAMRLSERAFQIDGMPAKEDWKAEAGSACGLELEEDTVLTAEAAPFWTGRWWKAAHALLQLTPMWALRAFRGRQPYTFDNLVAACFVGQAFHFGVAEYGVLVFRKMGGWRDDDG